MAAAASTPLNLIGLCAGVGMLDEGVRAGLEHLGFSPRVLAYVERESYAAATLLARMEDESLEPAPVWCGDLEQLDCGLFAGKVDGIVAGFPCQPWSVAGTKLGTDDARWIFPAIVDIVRRTGAWLVVFENVPGLVSGGGLDPVLGALAEERFDAEWLSLRAAAVGASHQRQRVIIVGVRRDRRDWLDLGHDGLQHVDLQQRTHGAEHPGAGGGVADGECARWRSEARADEAGRCGVEQQGGPRRGECGGPVKRRSKFGGFCLADSECGGWGERGRAAAVEPGERSRGAIPELADAGCASDQRCGRPDILLRAAGSPEGQGNQRQRDGHAARDGGEDLADDVGEGASQWQGLSGDAREECEAAERDRSRVATGGGGNELFAPGPGDLRWRGIIDRSPGLAPAVEPGLRVLVDGVAVVVDEARADQLRCAGNGVVTLWAAVATVIACRRLMA